MIIKTGRFGQLSVEDNEKIYIPQGVLGFPEQKNYCLVDTGEETLILWLQSIDNPDLAFPVLEPKVFKPDYSVNLSAAELRELKLEKLSNIAVFSILTIPEDIKEMTANLKAPIVINLKEQIAKQVVLQENEYSIKHLMFKELRSHLLTIQGNQAPAAAPVPESKPSSTGAVSLSAISPSRTVRSLQLV